MAREVPNQRFPMSHRIQLRRSLSDAIGVRLGILLAGMCCAGASAAGASTAGAELTGPGSSILWSEPRETEPSVPGGRKAAGLRGRWKAQDLELNGLRQAELNADLDELWAFNPRLSLRVILLRAGRALPATLTATRRSERLAQREAALDWLRLHLAADARVTKLWESVVRAGLADPEETVLWAATVRTLGRLGATPFALEIIEDMGSGDAWREGIIQQALFDLYLRWFESVQEFEAFWPAAQASGDQGVYMATARSKVEEARQLLIKLLKHEPARASALLKHPDPRLRAAAIHALGQSQDESSLETNTALLAHLELEVEGVAFYATINALLQALSGTESDQASLERIRQVFGKRIREGQVDLQAPIADAMRRLPWSVDVEKPDSLLVAVNELVVQLQGLAEPRRLTDRDTIVSCLASLQSLAVQADRAELAVAKSLAPIGPMLLRMLEDPREANGVRIAAAEFLTLVGGAPGITRAIRVLQASNTSPELRYNLLGAIGDMARELALDDPAVEQVLMTLLRYAGSEDTNMRRRSLKYVGMEAFRPLLAKADPGAFLVSLARETRPELQLQILDLVAAHGSSKQLEQLVALPNFDAICTSGPAGLTRLANTIRSLSGKDAIHLVKSIARLVAVHDGDTRVARLREALAAVAALPLDSLGGLEAADHHLVVLWSMEMRGAAGSVPGGAEFLSRLLSQHIPGCGGLPELVNAPELAHVRALFLSDLLPLDPSAVAPAEVVEEFARALSLSESEKERARHQLILRDRARYHLNRSENGAASQDYLDLLSAELPALEAQEAPIANLLDQRDLRRAGALFAPEVTAEEGEGDAIPRRPRLAWRASLVLVRQDVWKVEPVALRAQDLRDLVDRAIALADLSVIESALVVLSKLPPLPEPVAEGEPAPALPQAPEGALWAGLLESSEVHLELLGLHKSLELRGVEITAAAQAEALEKVVEPAVEEPAVVGPDSDAIEAGSKETKESSSGG